MAYELRILGSPPTRFEDDDKVLDAIELAVRADRAAVIDVIDLATGRPAALGRRRHEKEHHKKPLAR